MIRAEEAFNDKDRLALLGLDGFESDAARDSISKLMMAVKSVPDVALALIFTIRLIFND